MQAHPELIHPRRPYQAELEAILFDMRRVYHYLAGFTFECKVNRNGQVTLKGHHYTVGLAHKEKQILVRLDEQTQEWMFLERDEQGQEQELNRRPLFGLDFFSLTGLEKPECLAYLPPIQLTLPLAPLTGGYDFLGLLRYEIMGLYRYEIMRPYTRTHVKLMTTNKIFDQ